MIYSNIKQYHLDFDVAGVQSSARLASKEGCCNARNVAMERDASEVHVLMRFSALTYLAVNSSHLFDLFDKARKSTTTTGF